MNYLFSNNISSSIQPILADFLEIMQAHYGEELYGILLYGSYARDEAHEESDIDVLVIIDRIEIDVYEEVTDIVSLIYELDYKYNQILSVFPMSETEWESGDSFFLNQVRKDRIYLWRNTLVQ
ncbi:MAG: nucleotidyltransferase domain-containing protein [Bacteroidota bacterium]